MLSANTAWLVPNTTKKPMNDTAFRRALATSIDINKIVTAVYGQHRHEGRPDRPAADLGQVDRQGPVARSGFSYNTAKAKALLAGAGYKDTNGDGFVENKDGSPIKLKIIVPNGWSDWMTAIQVIADSAKAAGIRITPAYPRLQRRWSTSATPASST